MTMSDEHFHISKAERNEDFYRSYKLLSSKFNEWAIVVLFYSAMHYVDAVLSRDTTLPDEWRDPQNHKVRNFAISQCSELDAVASKYLVLFDRGWDARYRKISFPDNFVETTVSTFFEPTKRHIRKCLGLS